MAVFFISLFPGGVVSNLVFVQTELRNFRLSTVLSFLQNLVTVISVPVAMSVLWAARPDDINSDDIHWLRLLVMMLSMLLLSLLGLLLRRSMSDERSKSVMSMCGDLSTSVNIFVLLLVLLIYSGKMLRASVGQWAVAALVQLGCGFSGAMTAVMFNCKASECITVGTEFAFRNCFLAIGVISFSFSGQTREDMFIFALIYSFVSSLLVLVIIPIKKYCCCFGSKDDSASLDAGLISISQSRSDALPPLTNTTSNSTGEAYSF